MHEQEHDAEPSGYPGPFQVLKCARACSCLTVHEFAVLCVLICRADNDTGVCSVPAGTVAAEAKVSDRGARNAFASLKAGGWLHLERRSTKQPTGTEARLPHRFTITIPAGHVCPEPVTPPAPDAGPPAGHTGPSGTGCRTSGTGCLTPPAPDAGPPARGADISTSGSALGSALPPPGAAPCAEAGDGTQRSLPIDGIIPPEELAIREAIAADPTLSKLCKNLPQLAHDLATVANGAVDVVQQIRNAGAWCRNNPSKTPKNAGNRFLDGWVRRELKGSKNDGHPRRGAIPVQRAPPENPYADADYIRGARMPAPQKGPDGEPILW